LYLKDYQLDSIIPEKKHGWSRDQFRVELRGALSCPFCQSTELYTLYTWKFAQNSQGKENLKRELEQFSVQTHNCAQCGIVSALPKNLAEELIKKIRVLFHRTKEEFYKQQELLEANP